MASRINLDVDVNLRGAFLKGRDGPIIRRFYRDAKILVAEEGVKELKARALSQPRHPTGAFSDAIQVHDFKKGRTIMAAYPQTLYGPWLEGTSERNTSTRFKGYRMFRRTLARLRRNLSPIIRDRFTQTLNELRGDA